MGWIIAIVVMVVAVLVGHSNADNKDEELLVLKLFGYALLGFLTLNLGGLPLPLGFLIGLLLAGRAPENARARRYAAVITFVWWLISLFLF